MEVKQVYTNCLAQGAYYIESNGEAVIIDPLREVEPYIQLAKERGASIKYIFETHFHADFVSGHLSLSKQTDAPIVFGPTANPLFEAIIAKDQEIFTIGDLTIKVLHTPGHTMESTTYLLLDEEGKEYAVFTGDTLFLGDVGRPDLAQKAANMTQEDLAGLLFDSLRTKIMTLPPDTLVYPGHGAGSACGKNMRKETVGTIGEELKTNYALRANMTKSEFIKEVTQGILPPPGYFPDNVRLNKEGYDDVKDILGAIPWLTVKEFEQQAKKKGTVILDVRAKEDYANGHIPNSLFIGLDGGFAPWVGAILKEVTKPILLVAPKEKYQEAIIRLARVGFDTIEGCLIDGFGSWVKAGKLVEVTDTTSVYGLENEMELNKVTILDVRKKSEYLSQHIPSAMNIPLEDLADRLTELAVDETYYVHCQSGYRSLIANSILKQNGFSKVMDIQGGIQAISKETNIGLTDYVCPSKQV